MEKIVHSKIKVHDINIYVVEIGEGPAVLFLHDFPELWYSWHHQMLSLSSKGYRAIAPDLRGYGDSDAPPSTTGYTALYIVGGVVALLDSLGLDKVFLVGHDWGALISWYLCLFRPDKVKALVNMSVVFTRRNPLRKPLDICRFQVFDLYGVGCKKCYATPKLLKELKLKVGKLSTGDSLDMSPQDEASIIANDATVKDMEGAAVAYVADLLKVPAIFVKAVTDIVDGNKPTAEEFLQNLAAVTAALDQDVANVVDYINGKSLSEL